MHSDHSIYYSIKYFYYYKLMSAGLTVRLSFSTVQTLLYRKIRGGAEVPHGAVRLLVEKKMALHVFLWD